MKSLRILLSSLKLFFIGLIMSSNEYIDLLKNHPEMPLFHVNDFALMMNQKKEVIRVELVRMVKKGLLSKVTNGYYANPFLYPTSDQIAMYLKKPSYISLEKALNIHGILPQTVYTYTLVTADSPHSYRVNQTIFEYHHILLPYFFGFKASSQHIYLADPEKALLDFLYFRYFREKLSNRQPVFSLLDDMDFEIINKNRFLSYAQKMGLKNKIKTTFKDIF
jgi:predicted transcriptional regulator of viral defense system